MSLLDFEPIEHAADVRSGARLRIARSRRRHGGGRVTAGVVGNAAIASGEIAHLRLPTAEVAGKLVHEHDRGATTHFLVVEGNVVVGADVGHGALGPDRLLKGPGDARAPVSFAGYRHRRYWQRGRACERPRAARSTRSA